MFSVQIFFIDYVGKIVQDYFLHNFIFWLDLIWILHNFSLDFQTYLRIKYERKCDIFTQPQKFDFCDNFTVLLEQSNYFLLQSGYFQKPLKIFGQKRSVTRYSNQNKNKTGGLQKKI